MRSIEQIKKLYESGMSYSEIRNFTGDSFYYIAKAVRGTRTKSEAAKICRDKGNWCLSEDGRNKIRDMAIMSITSSNKMMTKPERQFIEIMGLIGIGIKYPKSVEEKYNVKSDEYPILYFQYPIQRYLCDFVDVELKIVYRIQGDYWHSNPIIYKNKKPTEQQKNNLRHDTLCKNYLERNGWTVIDIWESEIYWNKEKVKNICRVSSPEERLYYTQYVTGSIPVPCTNFDEEWESFLLKKIRKEKKDKTKIMCKFCKKEFHPSNHRIKYCSVKCAGMSKRKIERPEKEELENEINNNSILSVGRKYGVSDSAIRKWMKRYGISKRKL